MFGKLALAAVAGVVGWRLAKRVWLFREGTEAEPPTQSAERLAEEDTAATPDRIDQAIFESFPASDPPSFVAGLDPY